MSKTPPFPPQDIFLRFLPRAAALLIPSLAAMLLWAALVGAADESPEVTFFRIGTGATSGTYFPIGGLIASAISNPPGSRACESGGSCGVPGLIAVAQSTEGSVANIEAMANGTLDSGLAQADVAYWAFSGTKLYKDNAIGANLRVIANLFPESIHVVVGRDSGIESISDLKGKRVSLGEPESGTLASVPLILKGYGLSKEMLKPFYLTPGQAADKMREGELDAFFLIAGPPVTAISDLAREMPISLVPIADETAEKIRKSNPFFVQSTIEESVYENVATTPTLSVGAQWLITAEAPEDLVYGITEALWHENVRALIESGHPIGKSLRLERALDGVAIPLHPGAERYYLQRGLKK